MHYEYTPKGVCAKKIAFELNDDKVSNVQFSSGCNGFGKAVSALCEGRKVEEVKEKLKEITCGSKPTSCAAELVKALTAADDN